MPHFLDLSYYKNGYHNIPAILQPFREKNINYRKGDIYDSITKLANCEYGQTLYNLFSTKNDYLVLHNYAKTHGIYLEKYYVRHLSNRINTQIIENKIDLKEFYPLYCTQYDFGPYEKVEKHLKRNLIHDFYKISIYKLNNEQIFKLISDWQIENLVSSTCTVCGKKYKIAEFPDWVYYGAAGHTNVCFECPIIISQTKEELLRLIPLLINSCGFIPNANFNPINHDFSARVKDESWSETLNIIFQMGISGFDRLISDNIFKQSFGSWFKALIEAKILKNNIYITSRGIKCISKNGNECNSLDEQYIDNWLYDNGFDYIKEPTYPKHAKYNKYGRKRADWYVNEHYIEYFGLKGNEKYDKKTEEKIKLARELNLKLIAIFPEDLILLKTKMKKILE